MTPFPGPRSVLVMDNCVIHHNAGIKASVLAAGMQIRFLPPYSPHLNPVSDPRREHPRPVLRACPDHLRMGCDGLGRVREGQIEEAFACTKSWIRRNRDACAALPPARVLHEDLFTAIDGRKTSAWIRHSGYRFASEPF